MVDGIYVGKDLGWRELDTSEFAVEHYIAITDDAHSWYLDSSPLGKSLVPATFFHFQAFNHNPGWFPSNTYGTLFARLRWQWCQPLFVGEPARSHAWISEIHRKGDRWHVTCDVDVFGPDSQIAVRTRTTQTFLVDQDFRGEVRSPQIPRKGAVSNSSAFQAPGAVELQPLRKVVTTEMCERFFGGTKNYHTDAKESRNMGFGDIVVGGPMSVCYIGAMLTQSVGSDLFVGGELDIRFVDILWPNAEISIVGSRDAEPILEFSRARYPFRIQIHDPAGRTTVIASGSYVVP